MFCDMGITTTTTPTTMFMLFKDKCHPDHLASEAKFLMVVDLDNLFDSARGMGDARKQINNTEGGGGSLKKAAHQLLQSTTGRIKTFHFFQ
mmetsp:Transcript_7815/g.9481  ORF Transcript_7815/g.9481 Transcript_7815/m.9481 type:complete len:91 (+) Transcript_7815:114-386(+)